jgi:solute carrier family 9 (sodium/hydrogen exchanger), member 6/7
VVLGIVLWVWTRIPIEGIDLTFVDALSVGATLSATDPVTILAIFSTYKVDPNLYTIIFGESILNDAIAIVLFQTAQKYTHGAAQGELTVLSLFESIGVFLLVFFGSLITGLIVGVLTSLMLKLTMVRRFPKIESCVIILVAYASYFFSNAIHMSGTLIKVSIQVAAANWTLGIVSLLFCGICMKHYAYHNMSRRTQLTTKFVFQVMAQLSENFIFIYLGLSLFTDKDLDYRPLFILVSVFGICIARWCAVFPLSRAINSFISYKARRRGRDDSEALPFNHQVMIFWAGLRGAVGVALAAGLTGNHAKILRATVLIVVVLTVIIFGGTTARMLEILNIRTGVVEEIDSDDEFDIEVINGGGVYSRNAGKGFGNNPRRASNGFALSNVESNGRRASDADRDKPRPGLFRSNTRGSRSTSRATANGFSATRSSSRAAAEAAEQGLLGSGESGSGDEEAVDLDLPPQARRFQAGSRISSPMRPNTETQASTSALPTHTGESSLGMGGAAAPAEQHSRLGAATGAITQLFHGLSEDPATAFRQIDEGFIKPHLLLDSSRSDRHGGGSGGH